MSARTVRVRIAVAVDADGDWSAVGRSSRSDRESANIAAASECVATESLVHWVEADLPIPESQTVQGVVAQDGA